MYRNLRFKILFKDIKWKILVASAYFRARLYRLRLKHVAFIGITGSAGKTTTKDLCYLILSAFYPVAHSKKSRNITKDIADSVLDTGSQHVFSIIEISGHKPGGLDLPMSLLKPKIGVLTIIGQDHFKTFHGLGMVGIAAEKAKLIYALPKDGVAVLNLDDPRVKEIGDRCQARIIWVGRAEGATLKLLDATSRYPHPLTLRVEYQGEIHEVVTGLHGTHLALTVLCALGVALAAGLTLEQAIPRLVLALPVEGRMQPVVMEDGVTFLRDDAKAPGWSLFAPLEYLGQAVTSRKVAVIGSLSDFPNNSSHRYKLAAREAMQHADLVVFVGQSAHRALRARKDEHDQTLQGFPTMREAANYLRETLHAGDLVLLKGSMKVDHLERLVFDRQRPISCWRERCGFDMFCDSCSYLYFEVKPQEMALEVGSQRAIEEALILPKPPSADSIVPVIVGLGNPGAQYHGTLHNIGYSVMDLLAERYKGAWQSGKTGSFCEIFLDGNLVRLFKADAYINKTGPKLRHFLESTGCPPSHCLIVYDDLDIEYGKLRFKPDGGDAGHRGIRSCLMALGTNAVPRLRFGVRESGKTGKAKSYVQTSLTKHAQIQLPKIMDEAVTIICQSLTEAISKNALSLPPVDSSDSGLRQCKWSDSRKTVTVEVESQ